MSIEQRFQAAVNVIKGLPPKGPYQPSYDMMLRFYSYFKQVSEGPCKSRRPAFWDIVGKAKYDAWKRLGEMPKEKAMQSYVDELKQIVETMSFTQNVADFYGSINDLDNISVGDLELVAPELMRSKSSPNSPYRDRNLTDSISDNSADIPNESYTAATNGRQNVRTYSSSPSETSDDDEYIDTVEDEIVIPESRPTLNYAHQNGGIHKKSMPMTEVTNKLNIDPSIMTHLVQSITDNMKADMQQVNSRLSSLEQKMQIDRRRKHPSWWPFQDVSPSFFAFTIIWPVVVAIVLQRNKLNRGVGRQS